MTKPQYVRLEQFIKERAGIWSERMGLEHIEIEHVFLDSFDYGGESADDYKVTAMTEGRWNYLEAKIKWFLPSMIRHSDERNEKVLVHELCHVLLMPEQTLIDYKLDAVSSGESASGDEFDALTDMYYERLEMATENVARTLWKAWGPVKVGNNGDG